MITNVLFIVTLFGLGLWLETINGKNGIVDELLAPWPLVTGGGIYMLCFERVLW